MTEQKPWVTELSISPQEYQSWLEAKDPGQSVTLWALQKGKIPTDLYLNWARNHYGLPSLKSEFLDSPPPLDLWRNLAPLCEWPDGLLPIGMWSGIVYVACVEPPTKAHFEFRTQFILIDPRDLVLLSKSFYVVTQEPTGVAQLPPVPVPANDPSQLHSVHRGAVDFSGEINSNDSSNDEAPDLQGPIEPAPVVQEESDNDILSLSEDDLVSLNESSNEEDSIENIEESEFEYQSSETFEANNENKIESIESPIEDLPPAPPMAHEHTRSDSSVTEEPPSPPETLGASSESSVSAEDLFAMPMDDSLEENSGDNAAISFSELPEGFNIEPQEIDSGLSLNSSSEEEVPVGLSADEPLNSGVDSEDSQTEDPTIAVPIGAHGSLPVDEPLKEDPLDSSKAINDPTPDIPDEAKSQKIDEPTSRPIPSDHDVFEMAENETAQLGESKDSEGVQSSVHQKTPLKNRSENDFQESAAYGIGGEKFLPGKSYHNADSQSEVLGYLVDNLNHKYRYSIVMLSDSSQLTPWRWSNFMAAHEPETIEPISLSQPSIFRIVSRTKLPFFGKVYSSEVNEKFFKAWGFQDLPDHATVCPITSEGFVIGAVLCFGLLVEESQDLLEFTYRQVEEMTIALHKAKNAA
ncbi:MAG: hypothetical protein KDD61_07460 [Bdellovibrionales bacterium]|nr:hypothetical protein [Bdellovibrionales bacterium]